MAITKRAIDIVFNHAERQVKEISISLTVKIKQKIMQTLL
jgi:hypothetical protein